MKFYDLHTHSVFSGGESSLEELARTAKTLGYSGICFVVYYKDRMQHEIILAEMEKIRESVGIEILLGFEARTVRELKFLAERRREFDVLIARGGELEVNREACETPEVDMLSHPEYGRTDPGMNQVLAKLAAKNNVAIEINFREILTSAKKTRSKILANMQGNVRLVKKYRTPIILCSGATNHFELRDPRCMISMACQLGLELKEAKNAMSDVPEKIIKKIKERRGGKWIMPGVNVK